MAASFVMMLSVFYSLNATSFYITGNDSACYESGSLNTTLSNPGSEGQDNVKFTVTLEEKVLQSDVTITSWTIAGDQILMGSQWNPADTNNDMSLVGGSYQLVKHAYLTEGGYDYKAMANHTWSIKEIPESGNQTLQIDSDGDYVVTFSLDAQGTTLSANAELDTGEPAVTGITITGDKKTGKQLTFIATTSSFWGTPTIKYSVRLGQGEYTELQGNTFTPTVAGNYTVKAVATYSAQEASKEVNFTVDYSLTIGEAGYATIYSNQKLTVPANVEVYGYTYDSALDALIPGDVIPVGSTLPANKGFVVKATAGEYCFNVSTSEAGSFTSDLIGYNADKSTSEVTGTVFGLGQPTGKKLSFYKYSGATIPAGKAVYVKSVN